MALFGFRFRRTSWLVTVLLVAFCEGNSGLQTAVAQPGSLDPSFDPGSGANGIVNAVVVQSSGKVVIGGEFTTINGVPQAYLARLNENGSVDTSFNLTEGFLGPITVLALQSDDKIIAGGFGVARLNANGTRDINFFSGNSVSAVNGLALQDDGFVVVGGSKLMRLDTEGLPDPDFKPAIVLSPVYAVAIHKDGNLIASGVTPLDFQPVSVWHTVRFGSSGSLDGSFKNGAGAASCLGIQTDGKILLGFDGVSRVNFDGSYDPSFNPPSGFGGAITEVRSIAAQQDGRIVLGGKFSVLNGLSRKNVARLNSDGSVDEVFDPGLGVQGDFATGVQVLVASVAIDKVGRIIIGGRFSNVNGISRNGIARLQASDASEIAPVITSQPPA